MRRRRVSRSASDSYVVDDHSRFAYSEILADEKAATCTAFFARALERFDAEGVYGSRGHDRQHWSYTRSIALAALLAGANIKHRRIKPHCPWQNGKVERFNRTRQTEWAYRQVYATNTERSAAFAPWLEDYNTHRRHSAPGPTADQPTVTNGTAEYT